MTKSLIRDYTLQGIADTIREKKEVIGSWSTQDENTQYVFNNDGTGTMTLNGESTPITYEYSSSNNQLAITKPIYHYLIKNGRYTQESGGFTIELHAATAELKVDEEEGKLHLYSGIWGASYFYNNTPFNVSDYNEIVFDYSHTPNGNQSFNVLTSNTSSASSVIENIVTPGGGYTGRITRRLTIPKPVPQTMDRLYCDIANLGDKPAEVTPTSRYGVEIWNVYFEGTQTDTYTCTFNDGVMTLEDINQNETELNNLDKFLPSEMDDEINTLPYADTEEDVFNMILEPNSGSTFQSNLFIPIKKPVIINVHLTDNTSLGSKFLDVIKTTFSDITIKGHILGKTNQNAPALNFRNSSSKKIDIGDLYIDESNFSGSFSSTWLDMYFGSCKQLEHLVLPKRYNVYKIEMAQGYSLDFSNCTSLKTIENLDEAYEYMFPHATHSAYYGGYYVRDIFRGCSSIESLFLNMEYLTQTEHDYLLWDMCYGCTSLKSFEFRNSQLLQGNIKISEMFYNCSNLETVTGIDSIPSNKITSIYSLFYGCTKLASLPSICQETSLDDIHDMVRNSGITGNYTLNYQNLSSGNNAFNSSKITGVSLIIGNDEMTTSNYINLSSMFASCTLLEHAVVTSRGEPLISLPSTFEYCQSLIDAEINVKTITALNRTFYECRNLTAVDMSDVSFSSTASNVNINDMFYHCYSLTDIDIRNLDLSQASSTTSNTTFSNLPNGCTVHVKNDASRQFIETRNSNLNIIVEEV